MTQKELVKLAWKHKRGIKPNASKAFIMSFINEALAGNNQEWLPIALEYQRLSNRLNNLNILTK